jgi:hypothetical protein
LAEQRHEKPLEGSIKGVEIGENRNKIQDMAMFHDSASTIIFASLARFYLLLCTVAILTSSKKLF